MNEKTVETEELIFSRRFGDFGQCWFGIYGMNLKKFKVIKPF